jgi:hypothetical protein
VRTILKCMKWNLAFELKSMEHRVRTANYSEFCSWIHNRFGQDQHELLIRQLDGYSPWNIGFVQLITLSFVVGFITVLVRINMNY